MKRVVFIAAASVSAAQYAVPAGAEATVPGGSDLVERSSAFDRDGFAALAGRPARIRQVWDNAGLKPAVLNNIKNALNGFVFGFSYRPDQIALAVVNHAASASYSYADSIWMKYGIGEFVGALDANGRGHVANPFYSARSSWTAGADPEDERGFYHDTSIEALQRRGVMFFTCHTAVQEQARTLVKTRRAPASMTAREVADDILTHLIPGAVVVPSGVATVAVLQQQYGYAYITVQS